MAMPCGDVEEGGPAASDRRRSEGGELWGCVGGELAALRKHAADAVDGGRLDHVAGEAGIAAHFPACLVVVGGQGDDRDGGRPFSFSMSRMRAVASRPSMPGISRSMNTMPKPPEANISTA